MYQRMALCGTSRYARLCVTKLDIDKLGVRVEFLFCKNLSRNKAGAGHSTV